MSIFLGLPVLKIWTHLTSFTLKTYTKGWTHSSFFSALSFEAVLWQVHNSVSLLWFPWQRWQTPVSLVAASGCNEAPRRFRLHVNVSRLTDTDYMTNITNKTFYLVPKSARECSRTKTRQTTKSKTDVLIWTLTSSTAVTADFPWSSEHRPGE